MQGRSHNNNIIRAMSISSHKSIDPWLKPFIKSRPFAEQTERRYINPAHACTQMNIINLHNSVNANLLICLEYAKLVQQQQQSCTAMFHYISPPFYTLCTRSPFTLLFSLPLMCLLLCTVLQEHCSFQLGQLKAARFAHKRSLLS